MAGIQQAIDKALAVEHLSMPPAIRVTPRGIDGPEDLGRGAEDIDQARCRDLVRHGDDQAIQIVQLPKARP